MCFGMVVILMCCICLKIIFSIKMRRYIILHNNITNKLHPWNRILLQKFTNSLMSVHYVNKYAYRHLKLLYLLMTLCIVTHLQFICPHTHTHTQNSYECHFVSERWFAVSTVDFWFVMPCLLKMEAVCSDKVFVLVFKYT